MATASAHIAPFRYTIVPESSASAKHGRAFWFGANLCAQLQLIELISPCSNEKFLLLKESCQGEIGARLMAELMSKSAQR